MNSNSIPHRLAIRRNAKIFAVCAAIGMLLFVFAPAHAQDAVADLVSKAQKALEETFTPCGSSKFLECITFENSGWQASGFMNRTINDGTEATDINVTGSLSAADAQGVFQIDAESYGKQDPTVQFWSSETFAAAPGQVGSGVLTVWFPPNPDSLQGNGRGAMLCGNLNVRFEIFLTAPPGTIRTDEKALVEATHSQLRGLMEQTGIALSQAGACVSDAPPLELKPIASAAPYSLYEGETTKLSGVVWAMDKDGLNHGPVSAKLEIFGGAKNAHITGATDAQGYFEIDYPALDATSGVIFIRALSPDAKRYADGMETLNLEVKKRGALQITLAADKPTYKQGETLVLKGNVLSDGVYVPANVSFYSDALPLKSVPVNGDGSFTFSFVPGTEPKRNQLGPFLPGVHYALAKATALGYETGDTSANYLVLSDLNTDDCIPLPVQVRAVTGIANVLPMSEEELNKQNIVSGFARVNENTWLASGMSVQTSGGARVALSFDFGNGSVATVVLNSASTLQIGRYCKDATGQVHAVLLVNGLGQVAANVVNASADQGPLDFNILTPSVSVKSVHTRYLINVDPLEATTVAALEGAVIVSDPSGAHGIEVAQGNRIEVRTGDTPDPSKISLLGGQLEPVLEAMLVGTGAPPLPPLGNSTLPTPALGGSVVPTTSSAVQGPDMIGWALPGLVLLGVLLAGAVFLVLPRFRKKPVASMQSSTADAVASPVSTPPPAVSGPPQHLPEQQIIPDAVKRDAITFQQAEDEYFKYRGQLATGRITQAEFERRLHDLMVQDSQGRYWLLGAASGKWFVHDGQAWVEATPE